MEMTCKPVMLFPWDDSFEIWNYTMRDPLRGEQPKTIYAYSTLCSLLDLWNRLLNITP
jgi:hypothetical protein